MQRFREPLRRAMLSLLLTIVPAACSTPSKPIPTAATAAVFSAPTPQICAVWKIVRYSAHDTPGTIEQVRQDNAARRVVCGD